MNYLEQRKRNLIHFHKDAIADLQQLIQRHKRELEALEAPEYKPDHVHYTDAPGAT